MTRSQTTKQSVYFKNLQLEELHREAARLDRSVMWIVQRCVTIAMREIQALPSLPKESKRG